VFANCDVVKIKNRFRIGLYVCLYQQANIGTLELVYISNQHQSSFVSRHTSVLQWTSELVCISRQHWYINGLQNLFASAGKHQYLWTPELVCLGRQTSGLQDFRTSEFVCISRLHWYINGLQKLFASADCIGTSMDFRNCWHQQATVVHQLTSEIVCFGSQTSGLVCFSMQTSGLVDSRTCLLLQAALVLVELYFVGEFCVFANFVRL
jgi:hypothetical protein